MADSNYVTTNQVPFTDDEEVRDDELLLDKPGISAEEKASRAQKRRDRAAEREQERKEQKETLDRVQRELAEERSARARLEGVVQGQARSNQVPAADPFESELEAIYAEQQNAWQQAQAEVKAGTYDEKRNAHYERLGRQLESRKMQVHTRRAVAEQASNTAAQAGKAVWQQKYPDVYGNKPAYDYAEATWKRKRLLGVEESPEMIEEVMEETRTAFKLGPKKAPSKVEKDRLSGFSSGGGGSNGASGGPTGGIDMTPALRRMAIAKYGGDGVSDEKAIKQWVDTEGKSLRAKKVL